MTKKCSFASLAVTVLASSVSLVLACSSAEGPPEDLGTNSSALSKTRSYLVLGTGEDSLPPGLEGKVAGIGGKVTRPLHSIGTMIVESSSPNFQQQASALLGVRSVVPNYRRRFLLPQEKSMHVLKGFPTTGDRGSGGTSNPVTPTDPTYPLQWGLQAVGAPAAWARGNFGKGARVAVLDTGIIPFHPDIAPNLDVADSISFVPGEDVFQSALAGYSYHGLHVAGIIAAAMDGSYSVGVAPQAELVAIKVLGNDGFATDGAILQGLMHAGDVHADIANLSIVGYIPRGGGCYTDGECITARDAAEQIHAYSRAVAYARRRGTTVIVAAGNEGLNVPLKAPDPSTGVASGKDIIEIPGSLPNVITVAATGPQGWGVNPHTANVYRPAHYSNRGTPFIEFAGPGGDDTYPHDRNCLAQASNFSMEIPCWVLDMVVSDFDFVSGGVAWMSGTSMATPHIAGLAALIVSEHGGRMAPARLELALRARAMDLGKNGRDDLYGLGFTRYGKCTPAKCTDADGAALCGTIADGCGGSLRCGSCAAGSGCSTETSTCCTPLTCAAYPAGTCGDVSDGCGGTLHCGGCGAGQACFGGTCCTPRTCADLGATCGSQDDGCGGTIDCGGCPTGQACGPGGQCCTPTTCTAGSSCGQSFDYCTGQFVDCGGCATGQECSGNTCCTPKTCADLGANCGLVNDGCNTWIDCGLCATGQVCADNICGAQPPSLLDCQCQDGTEQKACASSLSCDSSPAIDRACGQVCAGHGGLTFSMACTASRKCEQPGAPPPVVPTVPLAPGATRVACTCGNASTVSVCVDVSCGSSASLAALCTDLCSGNGGNGQATSCAAQSAQCTTSTAGGADLARCYCSSDTQFMTTPLDFCASLAGCSTGTEADALCSAECQLNGMQLAGSVCAGDAFDTVCTSP